MYNTKVIGGDQDSKSAALENVRQASTVPARLFSIIAYNDGVAGDLYIQVHDATSTPVDGTVPTCPPVKCLADNDRSIDFGDGATFAKGICVVASTTATTLTIAGARCLFFVNFRKSS